MCIKSEHLQVIEETPTVRLRNKKKEDISKYLEHRQSANFSSSGEAMRNNNISSSRSYLYPNCRVIKQQRPVSLDITDKFYFSECGRQKREEKKYHSSLDISEKPKQIEIKIERPHKSQYSLVPSQGTDRQVCTRSLVRKGEKFQSVGDICFTSSKEIPQVKGSQRDRKISGQLIFTSEKQPSRRETVEKSWKTSSCSNLSSRVIPIEMSGSCLSSPGSPATKYRTRVALHSQGLA